MDFGTINWLGVVLGSLAFFVLGAVWHGPLFGAQWRKAVGVPESAAPQVPAPSVLVMSLVSQILGVAVLAALLDAEPGTGEGLLAGALAGLLIAGLPIFSQFIYEKRPASWVGIELGYNAVGFALAGVIIAAFQ